MVVRVAVLTAIVFAVFVQAALAQTVLTYADVVARARERAAGVVTAAARVAEAEAELLGASARFRDNPVLEASAGPRFRSEGLLTDIDVGFSQLFETGGQRRARIAGAQALVERSRADVEEARREAVFAAVVSFVDAVAASERLRLAEESNAVSQELLNSTERRFTLGDIAAIDVNLSRIDAARSTAALRVARADFTAAVGLLRVAIGLTAEEPIELRGTLDFAPPPAIEVLRGSVEARPGFMALRAEITEAEARVQLGRALRKPDLGFRLAYEREDGDNIVLGGLTIALPAFQQGQGVLATGTAAATRLRLQLETARLAAATELATAYAVYEQHAALSSSLVQDAQPSLDDNEGLARRSFEAGELNLRDLLHIRRDALETRVAMIDRRQDAARSRITVDYLAGVLR